MSNSIKTLIWLLIAIPSCLSLTLTRNGRLQCEFYDKQCIDADAENPEILEKCSGIETCDSLDSVCYTTWDANGNNLTALIKEGRHHVHKMGCIPNQDSKCNISQCKEEKEKPVSGNVLFCCCTGNLCNADFQWAPKKKTDIAPSNPDKPAEPKKSNKLVITLIIVVLTITVFVALASWYCLRQRKEERFEVIPINEDPSGQLSGGDLGFIATLKLQDTPIELNHAIRPIGHGKYGTVYKGKMGDKLVAVKIFTLSGKGSYETERNIFALPLMNNHENILKCLGVDQRFNNSLDAEFWLVTEYHDKGSLHDFLKANMLSWDQLCTIAFNIASGLDFLHDDKRKHAITHRDFKSKNVLIKSDLTACISDFGLAHVFTPNQETNQEAFGQVAILFSRFFGSKMTSKLLRNDVRSNLMKARGFVYTLKAHAFLRARHYVTILTRKT